MSVEFQRLVLVERSYVERCIHVRRDGWPIIILERAMYNTASDSDSLTPDGRMHATATHFCGHVARLDLWRAVRSAVTTDWGQR